MRDPLQGYFAGAYWGPRYEGVEKSAERLSGLLSKLAQLEPLLGGWRDMDRTPVAEESVSIVTPHISDLADRLSVDRRRYENGELIPELGSELLWKNGQCDDSSAQLTIACDITSTQIGNHVIIRLPDRAAAGHLFTFPVARQIMLALISCWEPEWATWVNIDLAKRQGRHASERVAGWATYINDRAQLHRDLLPSSVVEETVAAGTLVIVDGAPDAVPLAEVLKVRAAMGYPV